MSVNFHKWEVNPAHHEILVSEIAEKLIMEPEWRSEFYELYLGEEKVDTSLVDMDKIQDIASVHGFIGSINPITGQTLQISSPLVREANGLWLLPSWINHSCWEANCLWFSKKSGFVCECTICKLDGSEVNRIGKDRKRYMKQIENINENYDKLRRLIKQLDSLRPNKPNLYLLKPVNELAEYYFNQKQYRQAATLWIKVYNMIKDSPLVHLAPKFTLQIAKTFFSFDNEAEGRKWVSVVNKDAVLCYGVEEVVQLFKINIVG